VARKEKGVHQGFSWVTAMGPGLPVPTRRTETSLRHRGSARFPTPLDWHGQALQPMKFPEGPKKGGSSGISMGRGDGTGLARANSPDVGFGHPALRSLEGNLASPSWLRSISCAARLARAALQPMKLSEGPKNGWCRTPAVNVVRQGWAAPNLGRVRGLTDCHQICTFEMYIKETRCLM